MSTQRTKESSEVQSSSEYVAVPVSAPNRPARKWRFRIVGYVVTAARRFTAALNPTVEFRKRNSPSDVPQGERVVHLRRTRTAEGLRHQETWARTASGHIVHRDRRISRGSRAYLLTKPLPPVDVRS